MPSVEAGAHLFLFSSKWCAEFYPVFGLSDFCWPLCRNSVTLKFCLTFCDDWKLIELFCSFFFLSFFFFEVTMIQILAYSMQIIRGCREKFIDAKKCQLSILNLLNLMYTVCIYELICNLN